MMFASHKTKRPTTPTPTPTPTLTLLVVLLFASISHSKQLGGVLALVDECTSDLDCSGGNGACQAGQCHCRAPWQGPLCGQLPTVGDARSPVSLALAANTTTQWTWGGSPIFDPATGLFHLFFSELSNDCGILHYCSNSRISRVSARQALGPYGNHTVVLPPRLATPALFDSGSTHGPSVRRLNNGTYALFYTGMLSTGPAPPDCTHHYDPREGDRASRRIGLALADSLDGPWRRQDTPWFGPAAGSWDHTDTSNASPVLLRNGSVLLLYKGRGTTQALGLAWAPDVFAPAAAWQRLPTPLPNVPGEDPFAWIDDETGVFHVLVHDGNGNASAGSHAWSEDGLAWHTTPGAAAASYTGRVLWANQTAAVLARRERPQLLLSDPGGGSYGRPAMLATSAQPCLPPEDYGMVCKSTTILQGLL